MDMSLDDIIKTKRIGTKPPQKGFIVKKNVRTGGITKRAPVIDARNKIIQKNRAKIRDAREKLAQITKASGDARLRLLRKRKDMSPKRWPMSGGGSVLPPAVDLRASKMGLLKPKAKPMNRKLRPQDLIGVPRGYVDYDNMELEEAAEYQPDYTALRMTVHNNIVHSRPERISSSRRANNDPFDCYEVPIHRPSDVSETVNIRRQIRGMSPDMLPRPKGILRPSRQASSPPPYSSRRYTPDGSSHLSYEMRHRLEHAPDPNQSMGIFANPLTKQSSYLSSSTEGCRIVVSNLHGSVTQSDIKELFEDIGELYEARLVRPGVAEVIYKTMKDAEKAVETYHNRQLDGQPMKCLLVNPRSSNKPTAPAIKPSNPLSSRSTSKTPLEIDIDALHKVLFRRH